MESAYTYAGVSRISLFWENPNHAGCALVVFIPFVWLAIKLSERGGNSTLYVIGIAAEVLLGWLLFRTLSRGAISALFFGGVAFGVLERCAFPASSPRIFSLRNAVARVAFFFALFIATPAGDRVSSTLGDPSILNRFDYWRGALICISWEPVAGWGRDKFGFIYANWIQLSDLAVAVSSPVSSILDVGVSFGLFVMAFIIMLFMTLIISGCFSIKENAGSWSDCIIASISSVCGFLFCNMFSTMWSVWSLWIILLGPACVLFYSWAYLCSRRKIRALVCSSFVSVICVLAVYFLGVLVAADIPLRAKRLDGGVHIQMRERANSDKVDLVVFPDRSMLRSAYGLPIRDVFRDTKIGSFAVVEARHSDFWKNLLDSSSALWFFGDRYDELLEIQDGRSNILAILPAGNIDDRSVHKGAKFILKEPNRFSDRLWVNSIEKEGSGIFYVNSIDGYPLSESVLNIAVCELNKSFGGGIADDHR